MCRLARAYSCPGGGRSAKGSKLGFVNGSWSFLFESVAWDSEEDSHRGQYNSRSVVLFGYYPCLVSLSLDRAWTPSSLGLGFVTRACDLVERGAALGPGQLRHGQSGRSL